MFYVKRHIVVYNSYDHGPISIHRSQTTETPVNRCFECSMLIIDSLKFALHRIVPVLYFFTYCFTDLRGQRYESKRGFGSSKGLVGWAPKPKNIFSFSNSHVGINES